MVKNMKKTVYVLLALFLLSFSSFTITAQPPEWSEITGLKYSNRIVPGTEVSWKVTKFETDDPESFIWEVYPGHPLAVGDMFKLNVTKDPDTVGLVHPSHLWNVTESWCDFYLNDVFLTENISYANLREFKRDYRLDAGYIVPTSISFASGYVNYFDYLYDYYSELDYGEDGSLKVRKTDETFTIEEKYKGPSNVIIMSPGGSSNTHPSEEPSLDQYIDTDANYNTKITYNIEWGVLVFADMQAENDTMKVRVVLETGIDEIAVPYEWLYGLFALLIMGLVTIKKKK